MHPKPSLGAVALISLFWAGGAAAFPLNTGSPPPFPPLALGGASSVLNPAPIGAGKAIAAITLGDTVGGVVGHDSALQAGFGPISRSYGNASGATDSGFTAVAPPSILQQSSAIASASTVGGDATTSAVAVSQVAYSFMSVCTTCAPGAQVIVNITSSVAAWFNLHGADPAAPPTAILGGPGVVAAVILAQPIIFGDLAFSFAPSFTPIVLDRVRLDLTDGLTKTSNGVSTITPNPAYDGTLYSLTNDTISVILKVNQLYVITLDAVVAVAAGESGYAWIDPTVALDQNQTLPGDVTLVVNDPTAVPEPTGLALLGAGLLGLLRARRR